MKLSSGMNKLHFQKIKHKLLSLSGTSIDSIEKACVKSWTVEPVLRQTLQPAIYLPENLNHVTGSWEGTTIEHEVEALMGGPKEHAATVAYRFENVSAIGGVLYGRRWKERLLTHSASESTSGPSQHIKSGTVACTWSGNHFFGHWVTDDLTLHLAAQEIGNPFILKRKPYLHELGYRQLLNVWCDSVDRADFDEIIVLRDFGQNSYKRKRYEELRGRLRGEIKTTGSKRIFLRRGSLGASRAISNADEVESYLISQGFSIIEAESLTPLEIATQSMGAEIVMGVEGSQIPHALLTMADGGTLCCVQPPSRFNNTIKGYTDCMTMRYAILVGSVAPDGFSIDIDELKRLLEKIESERARL